MTNRRDRPGARVAARVRALATLLLLTPFAACSRSGDPSEGGRVLVLAAASLQSALPEIAAEFERLTGTGVDLVFGSSGNLVAQIESGAPADLFLSADRAFVERLAAAGLAADGTSRDYAAGRLGLVAPPNRAPPAGIEALADPAFAVVSIANPEIAPYGRAALEALQAAGVWTVVQPRVVYADNIAQAAQFVQTGNADVGILALSSILEVPGWEHTPVDPTLHAPIVQAGTVIEGAANSAAAEELFDLIVSPIGREILARHGFGDPE